MRYTVAMIGETVTWLRLPRALLWVLIALAAMLVTYAAFRSYLSPEFLIGFANTVTC